MTKTYLALIYLLFTSMSMKAQQYDRIVIIVADDLGVNDLACYGNEFIETPRLDQLAEAGVKIEHAYAASPICSPTRASILTGITPARLGMTEHLRGVPSVLTSQRLRPPLNVTKIDTSIMTLPKMAKRQGLKTAIIGKWHLGSGQTGPSNYGYDFTFASGGPGLPKSYSFPFFANGVFPELEENSNSNKYLTDILGDESVRYIDKHAGQSYLLHINFYSPHVPIEAKSDLLEKYVNKRTLNPDEVFPNVHYAAMVENIDQNVGKIIDQLSLLGDLERTLIIFTSDHGGLDVKEVPAFELHTPPTDNGPLRGGKGYLYEGGIRIPWIMSHRLYQDRASSPVITTDLLNICAEALNSDIRTVDGKSYSELDAHATGDTDPRTLYWHFPHYSPQGGRPESAILRSGMKVINHYEGNFQEQFRTETNETNNNFYIDSEENELLLSLEQWLVEVNAKPAIGNPNYRPESKAISEFFTYINGLQTIAPNGGTGWYSQWNHLYDSEDMLIQDGKLNLLSNSTISGFMRQLDTPFSLDVNGDLWFSLDIDLVEKGEERIMTLELQDLSGSRILSYTLSEVDKVHTITTNVNVYSSNMSENISHALTGRIVLNESSPDSIYLWSNIDRSSLPNRMDAIISTSIEVDQDALVDRVSIQAIGSSNSQYLTADNLRLGQTYSDISDEYILPDFFAYESFDYMPNENLNGQGSTNQQWTGSWQNAGVLSINTAMIEAESIEAQNGLTTEGNKVIFDYKDDNTQIRMDRKLAQPMISDGTIYWLSFLLDTDPDSAPNNVSNVNLRNSASGLADGHRLSIGRIYGNEKLGFVTPPNGQRFVSDIDDWGLNWMVTKIITFADDRPDQIYTWINPDPTTKPEEEDADISNSNSFLKNGIDVIRLRAEGAGSNQTPLLTSYDEIRIATSWESVIRTKVEDLTNENKSILVYPNPAKDVINFDLLLDRPASVDISLVDMSGQRILDFGNQSLASGTHNFNYPITSDVTAGYYIISLNVNGQIHTKQIAIIK